MTIRLGWGQYVCAAAAAVCMCVSWSVLGRVVLCTESCILGVVGCQHWLGWVDGGMGGMGGGANVVLALALWASERS